MAVLSSRAGIEWGSNRGPVTQMIAMVLPKPPQRPVVMAFAHFSQCLLNDDFCEALTTAKTPTVTHAIILNALSSAST
jgi:PTS system nitrogen regulatory IIA component